MSLPALGYDLKTHANITTDHGSLGGKAAASPEGVTTHLDAASEYVSASGELGAGAQATADSAGGWFEGAFHAWGDHFGSAVLHVKALAAHALPSLPEWFPSLPF